MYKPLVAIGDDVDRALAQTAAVAALPDVEQSVEVVLLHVYQGRSVESPELVKHATESTGKSTARHPAAREAADWLGERDIDVTFADSTGEPADAILATARDVDADVIVLAVGKRSPVGKVLFGSDTQSILQDTDLPVLAVPPTLG